MYWHLQLSIYVIPIQNQLSSSSKSDQCMHHARKC